MIINEWQLGNKLNQALGAARPADFRLWLAFLSPAVEEQAEFNWPAETAPVPTDLRKRYQLPPERDLGLAAEDLADLRHSHQGFIDHGLTGWRLLDLLRPAPQVVRHDANKLPAELQASLSLHCRRKLQQQNPQLQTADPTLLYDVLQQLEDTP